MAEYEQIQEKVAKALYRLAGYDELVIQSFPNKAWDKLLTKEKWLKKADYILAIDGLETRAAKQDTEVYIGGFFDGKPKPTGLELELLNGFLLWLRDEANFVEVLKK